AMGRLQTFVNSTASPVTAADVRQAFSRSGLFLEARLAAASGAGETGTPAAPPAEADDLKAALIAFRQVLKTWLDTVPAAKPNVVASGTGSGLGSPSQGSPTGASAQPSTTATPATSAAPPDAGPAGDEVESALVRNVVAAAVDPRLARGVD